MFLSNLSFLLKLSENPSTIKQALLSIHNFLSDQPHTRQTMNKKKLAQVIEPTIVQLDVEDTSKVLEFSVHSCEILTRLAKELKVFFQQNGLFFKTSLLARLFST